jgi:hypothetical protein
MSDSAGPRRFEFVVDMPSTTVTYPTHATVGEAPALRDLPGRFTENVRLRDKRDPLVPIVAGEDQPIDGSCLGRRPGRSRWRDLDSSLLPAHRLSRRPLVHTERAASTPADLRCFAGACGREPLLVALGSTT